MRSTGRVIDTTYPLVASGHATEVKLTMPPAIRQKTTETAGLNLDPDQLSL
jgi:hypothetical protein